MPSDELLARRQVPVGRGVGALAIGAALVLRPTVERNPVPHTVDRRLLHPIGIIIGCPWMSAVKATPHTLLERP